ncbi:hypothetical protein FA15DRAFT_756530 [Coprinopsis marcescibilis]|uniref:Uncharacterized protein n=1 Tax=Coprinopsis marcescibilis TaxID=230819 RepID=A0A5C3KVA3_COPMA|nr:hypothetical protein FA15DRAFT_756530 [Coprinopsis marcescibilis]
MDFQATSTSYQLSTQSIAYQPAYTHTLAPLTPALTDSATQFPLYTRSFQPHRPRHGVAPPPQAEWTSQFEEAQMALEPKVIFTQPMPFISRLPTLAPTNTDPPFSLINQRPAPVDQLTLPDGHRTLDMFMLQNPPSSTATTPAPMPRSQQDDPRNDDGVYSGRYSYASPSMFTSAAWYHLLLSFSNLHFPATARPSQYRFILLSWALLSHGPLSVKIGLLAHKSPPSDTRSLQPQQPYHATSSQAEWSLRHHHQQQPQNGMPKASMYMQPRASSISQLSAPAPATDTAPSLFSSRNQRPAPVPQFNRSDSHTRLVNLFLQ